MILLSAVVITFNEEQNIPECIDSLKKITEDIIVVDRFSSDKTKMICLEKGVRFYERKWEGYSSAKNFGNDHAKHDWILSIDADEKISDELIESIRQEFKNPKSDAYQLSFLTNFCGKWIRHGAWYPEWHIRIFNKKKIHWEGALHEKLYIEKNSKIGKLNGFVFHFTVRNLEDYLKKKNIYTTLAAETMFREGKKATFTKLYLSPLVRFVADYFFLLGFLDGYQGYVIAKQSAHYVFLKYSKLKLLYRENNKS